MKKFSLEEIANDICEIDKELSLFNMFFHPFSYAKMRKLRKDLKELLALEMEKVILEKIKCIIELTHPKLENSVLLENSDITSNIIAKA